MPPPGAAPQPTLPGLSLRQRLDYEARRLGFSDVGVTDLAPFEEAAARARQALAAGRMAGLPWYTPERIEQARDLGRRFPWGRSLVALGYPYRPAAAALGGVPEPTSDPERPRGRIAGYALGEDYHLQLERLLAQLAHRLAELAPGLRWHRFVDHGRALDRAIAERAGLGFSGKHTQLISREAGSYVLLGSLVLSMELAPDQPSRRNCGTCRACLPSCPTGALVAPGVIDTPRCISYLTIEHQGLIPSALRPLMGSWVFGCDLCQEACPINARLAPTPVPVGQATTAHGPVPYPDLIELLELSEPEFQARFRSTTVRRSGRERLARNAALALGNVGQRAAVPALARALAADPSLVVRGASAWALGELGGPAAVQALLHSARDESDAAVQAEIRAALGRTAGPSPVSPWTTAFRAPFGIIAAVAGFAPVCAAVDIPPGAGRVIDVDGVEIAIFHVDGVFHALENSCASGGSIGEGELRGHVVTCPLDGETYDVRTGISPISDAIFVKHFDVRVDAGGNVLVRMEPTEDEDEDL